MTANGNGAAPPSPRVKTLLALRADMIKTIRTIEATLDAEGFPVRSAVVTRRERRQVTVNVAGEG